VQLFKHGLNETEFITSRFKDTQNFGRPFNLVLPSIDRFDTGKNVAASNRSVLDQPVNDSASILQVRKGTKNNQVLSLHKRIAKLGGE